MDKNQLERLAAALGRPVTTSYRDSPTTEATELRGIIRKARPDLYDLMAEDIKKEQEEQTTIVDLGQQKPIELELYLPRLNTSYKFPRCLENDVVIPYQNQIFVYNGKITNLKIESNYRDSLWGVVMLTKYVQERKNKKSIRFFPPRIESGEVLKNKKLWNVSIGDGVYVKPASIVFSTNDISKPTFCEDLATEARNQNISLPDSLLTTIFGPIHQKLKELYNQITNSA